MRSSLILGATLLLVAGATGLPAQQAPAASDPFARYVRPGECEQAAIRLTRLYWRDKRADTVVYGPASDSVPAPVVTAARACASRFTVAGAQERDLLDLAQLYTRAGQDDLAQAAIDRLLGTQAAMTPVQRGWTLYLLSNSLLGARPTRMENARKYLAQLDALGAPVALFRMLAHTQFAEYAITVNDRAGATSEARSALAAAKQLSRNDQIDFVFSTVDAYAALAMPLALQSGGPAAVALFDTVNTALLPLRPAGSSELAQLRNRIANARARYPLFGAKAPRIEANWWFNAPGETARPTPGKMTVLVFGGPTGGYENHAVIRRLNAKYAPTGLDAILTTSTRGYFRSQPMQSPATEADLAGKYFIDHLKLPVAVAVQETPFSIRATDGRRMNQQMSNSRNYFRGPSGVLIDGAGVVRLVASLSPEMEQVWRAVIEEAAR